MAPASAKRINGRGHEAKRRAPTVGRRVEQLGRKEGRRKERRSPAVVSAAASVKFWAKSYAPLVTGNTDRPSTTPAACTGSLARSLTSKEKKTEVTYSIEPAFNSRKQDS
jgi:hypothetical protein